MSTTKIVIDIRPSEESFQEWLTQAFIGLTGTDERAEAIWLATHAMLPHVTADE